MVTGETRLPEEILSQPARFVHPSPRWRRLSQLQHLSETIYIFPQEPPTKEPTLSFHLSGLPSCSHSSILPELMWFPWIWNQRKRRLGFSSTLLQRGHDWQRELPRRLRQKKIFFLSLFLKILLYFPGYTTLTPDFRNPEGFIRLVHLAKSPKESVWRGKSCHNQLSISQSGTPVRLVSTWLASASLSPTMCHLNSRQTSQKKSENILVGKAFSSGFHSNTKTPCSSDQRSTSMLMSVALAVSSPFILGAINNIIMIILYEHHVGRW